MIYLIKRVKNYINEQDYWEMVNEKELPLDKLIETYMDGSLQEGDQILKCELVGTVEKQLVIKQKEE